MPIQVIMPQFGESVVEGTITRWLKAKGEAVAEFEPLLEINTDKVDTEIPSPAAGVLLDILVEAGTTAQAGMLLAWIEPRAGAGTPAKSASIPAAPVPNHLPSAALPVPVQTSQTTQTVSNRQRERGFISPVVRRMAEEEQIDLSRIQGSGLGGRITKKDLQIYLESGQRTTILAAAPVPSDSDPVLPLTPVRKAIAEHMRMSKQTSPHATTVMEADLSRVAAHRKVNKETFERDSVNLTYTAYFVAAVVQALKANPMVNSSWSEAGIRIHRQINLGLATSLGEEGLIVPVIRQADSLSLIGIARAVNDLSGRARLHHLRPEEVKGGTFTLTNHGTTGSLFATPIINQPQCGILGVGLIQKRPVVITDSLGSDALTIRPMVYLSFTFDHRILDGAAADTFLSKVVESLEQFSHNAK